MGYGVTHKIFFEEPSKDLPDYIKTYAFEPGKIKNFRFVGIHNKDNKGKVGEGGYFTFETLSSSYELKLDFTELEKDKIQAVDRLSRKLYTDENGIEIPLTEEKYLANKEKYTPVYVGGVVYIRNIITEDETKAYWNGKDGNGHYLPKGIYGGKNSKLKITLTPKMGETHFMMVDQEGSGQGLQVELISDVYSERKNKKLKIEDRNTIYYNNDNVDLLTGSTKEIKNSKIESMIYLKDKSINGENTKKDFGMKYEGNLGKEAIIDAWTYFKNEKETNVKKFTLDCEEITDIKKYTLNAENKATKMQSQKVKSVNYSNNKESISEYRINAEDENKVSIIGNVIWNDEDNKDGIRADTIKIVLNKENEDGSITKVADKDVTANENWKYEFENLDRYSEDGAEIKYSIDAEEIPRYTKNIEEYSVENTHIASDPLKTKVSGIITWDDDNNNKGTRPDSVTVILNKKENGSITKVATKEVTAEDGWEYTFEDLYTMKINEVIYLVDEILPEGYEKEIIEYNIINRIEKDKQIPKNAPKGTISGSVYFDSNKNDGRKINISNGDIPIKDVKVDLYKVDKTNGKATKNKLNTVKTDELGNYYFGELDYTKIENNNFGESDYTGTDNTKEEAQTETSYEVIVNTPEYHVLSSKTATYSDIEIVYDEENTERLDVQNAPIFYAAAGSTKKIELKKEWATNPSWNFIITLYPRIRVYFGGYYLNSYNKYVEVPSLEFYADNLKNINGWKQTITNKPATWTDENGVVHDIVYYIKSEGISTGPLSTSYKDSKERGYTYTVEPKIRDIAISQAETQNMTITNMPRAFAISKILDEPAVRDVTFKFKIDDKPSANGETTSRTESVEILEGETEAYIEVIGEGGHYYTIEEVNIPEGFELNKTKSYMTVDGTVQDAPDPNNFKFQINNYPTNRGDKIYMCNFYNDYKKENIEISNKVSGTIGDTTKEFNYTLAINKNIKYNAIKTDNNGNTTNMNVENGSTFTLKDKEKLTISNLTSDVTYSVTQDGTNYITRVNDSDTLSVTYTSEGLDRKINFVNTLEYNPLSGIDIDNSKFNLLSILILCIATYYVMVVRNKPRLATEGYSRTILEIDNILARHHSGKICFGSLRKSTGKHHLRGGKHFEK